MDLTRRTFVTGGTLFVCGLSGCLETNQGEITLSIENESPSPRSVTLTVEQLTKADILFKTSIELTGDDGTEITRTVPRNDDLLLLVSTDAGVEDTFEWTEVKSALTIRITNDIIEFDTA
ncbi:hypothetical protein [Halocatena halophila]|uniref:hypothetical protein n=1 Tax=Halocatena halophila TaxID=2814576 RepID=UPI002ED16E0A